MTDRSKLCDDLDARLRDGTDKGALMEALATCLGEELRRFAAAKCGRRRGDVEDIAQDVLLAAQQYLGSFRGESSLRTWLYRLVISACSRRRRGRKNDPQLHRPLDDAGVLPREEPDPETALMVGERLEALGEALEELRPQDRALLSAVEWQGQSLAEAGQGQGLTVPAVKSRLFRIRQQLRDAINERFGLRPATPEA